LIKYLNVKSSWPPKLLTQVLWLREGLESWVLCFSPTHRFVRALAAATGQCPALANPGRNTARGQNRNTACRTKNGLPHGQRPMPTHYPTQKPQQMPQAKSNARPTLRTRPVTKANLGQRWGRRIKGHETLTSASWPMPRWVHRFNVKMCIFTNRNNAERLRGFAAQAIAADR